MKLDGAFPNTPKSFEDAMIAGIQKGKRRMKLRNKLRYAIAAAAMVLIVALAALAAGTGGTNDTTALDSSATQEPESVWNYDLGLPVTPKPTLQPLPTPEPTFVYATPNGRWYHAVSDCQGMQNASIITVEAAAQMGKFPCPICVPEGESVLTQTENMKQTALERLESLLPCCEEVYCEHYNTDRFWTDAEITNGIPHIRIYAGSMPVADYSVEEDECLELFFADVELMGKLSRSCSKEGSFSERFFDLHETCRNALLPAVLNTIHKETESIIPASADGYSLTHVWINMADGEPMSGRYYYSTRFNGSAVFTFHYVESDKLSGVLLNGQ